MTSKAPLWMRAKRYASYALRLEDPIASYYYGAYPEPINPLAYLRSWQSTRAKRRLSRDAELFALIDELRRQSGSTGCSYGDYALLYDTVLRCNPRRVLELGSGISSGVIALALKRLAGNGAPRLFVSMEENRHFHDQIVSIFPDSLRSFAQFRHSTITTEKYGAFTGIKYRDRPQHDYDFIFIDGPVLQGHDRATSFDADILDIVRDHREPDRIVALLDNRIPTLRILKKLMPTFRFRYHALTSATLIESRGSHRPATNSDD